MTAFQEGNICWHRDVFGSFNQSVYRFVGSRNVYVISIRPLSTEYNRM
jgi:hypothetical protein